MFANAKSVHEYYEEQRKKGVKFVEAMDKLKLIEYHMAAYGDWCLYQDEEGNLWEEYFGIGE